MQETRKRLYIYFGLEPSVEQNTTQRKLINFCDALVKLSWFGAIESTKNDFVIAPNERYFTEHRVTIRGTEDKLKQFSNEILKWNNSFPQGFPISIVVE